MENRIINLDTIPNCRQLGKLENIYGYKVRENTLLRSAALQKASQKDLDILKNEYDLYEVIDLRTNREIAEMPDITGKKILYRHSPIVDDFLDGVTHDKESERQWYEDEPFDMGEFYKEMVMSQIYRENFSITLKTIIHHDYGKGALLWHCSEGKDRCGLISMFVEELLDISRDDIYEDYLMTNIVNIPKGDMIYKQVKSHGASDEQADKIRDLFIARKEFLEAAYDIIDEIYGDMDNYLQTWLRISTEEKDIIKHKLLYK